MAEQAIEYRERVSEGKREKEKNSRRRKWKTTNLLRAQRLRGAEWLKKQQLLVATTKTLGFSLGHLGIYNDRENPKVNC